MGQFRDIMSLNPYDMDLYAFAQLAGIECGFEMGGPLQSKREMQCN